MLEENNLLVKLKVKKCLKLHVNILIEEAVLGTERCGVKNCLSIPNCIDECYAGPGERPANRHIGEGKEGDLSAPYGAHLLIQPTGKLSREGGHPQGWKAQTRREMADEMAY